VNTSPYSTQTRITRCKIFSTESLATELCQTRWRLGELKHTRILIYLSDPEQIGTGAKGEEERTAEKRAEKEVVGKG